VSTMDETYVRLYPDLELHHFWWKIRRKLVAQLISNRVDLTRCSVLDVGCGSGVTMEYLSDAGAAAVRGIEIDPLALRPSSAINDRIVLGDLLDLNIDETYDIVVMLDVLEHIEDDTSALAKVQSCMSRDGWLILTVPAYRWLWSTHDVTNAHFRRYSARQLRARLESSGFRVDQIGYMFAGLVPPKLVMRWLEMAGVDLGNASFEAGRRSSLSGLAYRWFIMEAALAVRFARMLPFGSSVVAVARPRRND
jgi:SAM-dependent methyltransferase